jgi:hypothetical protein
MDLKSIADRINHTPVFVILTFIAGTVVPIVASVANILPTSYAAITIVASLLLLGLYLVWPQLEASLAVATPTPASDKPQQTYDIQVSGPPTTDPYEQARRWIRRRFVSGMNDKAQLEYFYNWANKQDGHDDLFRIVIQEFKDDSDWGSVVAVVEEWVTIGFDAIVRMYANWKNASTLNQLYIACHKVLLREEIKFDDDRGVRFAELVASIVAARRREGY